jgi:hypothetical protein
MLDKKALSREIQDALETVDPKSKNLSKDTWNAVSAAIVKNLKNTVEVDKDFLPHTHPELQSSGEGAAASTNSNGTYIKFGDGTLICYGRDTQSGGPRTVTLPCAMYDNTYIVLGTADSSAFVSYGAVLTMIVKTKTTTTFDFYAGYYYNGGTGYYTENTNWTAIGRWKA